MLDSVITCWLRHSSLQKSAATHMQAAVRIQKHWRGHLQRSRLAHQNTAAAVVQRHWQAHTQARWHQHVRSCVIIIQSHIRRHQARHSFVRLRQAASHIQVGGFNLFEMTQLQVLNTTLLQVPS